MQESTVQILESLHALDAVDAVQQFGYLLWEHVCVTVLQESLVQSSPSRQSAAMLQPVADVLEEETPHAGAELDGGDVQVGPWRYT